MAAAHASATLWKKAFSSSPLYRGKQLAFGQTMWYKAKQYKGVKDKELDGMVNKDLPMRWKKASYRGPSMEVPEYHLLLREDGGLTIAKGLKTGVWEPQKELRPLLPELQVLDDDEPDTPTRRRMRAKTTVKMLEMDDQETEMDDCFEEARVDDLRPAFTSMDKSARMVPPLVAKAMVKKAEVQYTENVEGILQSLDQNKGSLEVTHNVSLDEVKDNLTIWTPGGQQLRRST